MSAAYCSNCRNLLVPVWFEEPERIKGILTGRYRKACSHLQCDNCGKSHAIDDSLDGPWYYKPIGLRGRA